MTRSEARQRSQRSPWRSLLAAGGGGLTAAATTAATDRSDALKVGLITDAGQLNDNGFNELAYKGLKRAERRARRRRAASSRRSRPRTTCPNIAALVRQGYQLVIGVGFAQGDAIATAAKRFPEVKFAIVDVDQRSLKGKPANVQGLLFREEQVGYLVGTLAALSAERAGGNMVSAVGGFKEPPVDRFIAGLPGGRRGGRARDEGDATRTPRTGRIRRSARSSRSTRSRKGSKVVFQVAGGCGLGALSAAKDKGVWGIGVDADQSFLGPHILTSALKGVDQAVFLTVKAVQDGTWQGGGNAVFGLDQEGVGLGTVSDKVPQEDIDAVEDAEQKIADGEIADIPTELGKS